MNKMNLFKYYGQASGQLLGLNKCMQIWYWKYLD